MCCGILIMPAFLLDSGAARRAIKPGKVKMSLDYEFEVHIPLTGKSIELDPLPGQDPTKRYGVVWDVCQQPDEGVGYVVEFHESRSCHLLAWIGKGGTVTECDRPIAFVTPGVPVLAVEHDKGDGANLVRARRHGSDELVTKVAYRSYFPGQYAFEALQAKASEGITDNADLTRVLGSYAGRRLAWRVFLAVSYLAFYLLPRLGSSVAAASGTIADVLRTFTAQPLPDAIDSLIFRVMEAQEGDETPSSGFERYAARMLQQAGSAELRQIATRHEIRVSRLSTTLMFWLRFPDDVTEEERAVLLSVEACLNRLELIEAGLRSQGESTALAAVGESRCALHDRRNLAGIADDAAVHFDASQEENPYCVYLPANPARGGEWDVRTRFLRTCERLRIPYRLEYRFDGDVEQGVLNVHFGVPAASAFPRSLWNENESRWEDHGSEQTARASLYALRLAALVASCAFGASLGIRTVLVTACAGSSTGTPVLSLAFERMSFLNRTLPHITSGAVARIGRDGNCATTHPAELLSLLAPKEARASFDGEGGLLPVEPLTATLSPSRLAMSDDQRTLPSFLAQLLHAQTVRDLDVEATTDLRELDEVQSAIEDAADSRLLAMARLEELAERNPLPDSEGKSGVVADAEAALRDGAAGLKRSGREADIEADVDRVLAMQNDADAFNFRVDDGGGASHVVRYAYFPNLMTRCAVGAIARDDNEEFRPVSAVVYRSRSALAKLYAESGDVDAAVARAYECSSLAPTSSGLQLELAQLMLVLNRPQDAITFLRQAIKVCARQQMATVLYTHLANAFWMGGDAESALAAFTLARGHAEGATPFDQAITQLAHSLKLKEVPSIERATSILLARNVPTAPSGTVRSLVVSAGVGFTDARMFELAWPLVGAMGIDIGNDVMAMMGEHLRVGLG